MKDAFDVLMITHAGLCKGYAEADPGYRRG